MTTLRSDADVLVLGSTLGGLVAATYLARAGLRVVLLEEGAHRKRPPLLREPFLLPGLGPNGAVRRVLRELALPLIDQRELREEPVALQVVLPQARVEVEPDCERLACELAAYRLADRIAALAWLERVQRSASTAREALFDDPAPPRTATRHLSPPSSLGSEFAKRVQNAVAARADAPLQIQAALPAPPPGLGPFITAQLMALAALSPPEGAPAPSLLLDGARSAVFRMPHSGAPFLDLFRRRFQTLHGEIWPVDEFALIEERNGVGVELARTRCFGQALVIAVPRDPLRRFLQELAKVPRFLRRSRPVERLGARLFRAERRELPVGLGTRVVVADRMPGRVHWLSFNPDPVHEGMEWLVASGPGAAALSPSNPLGDLAPFSSAGLTAVAGGPDPLWDLDSGELCFPLEEPPEALRARGPVVLVGPELAPGLGVEGEILQARRVAIRLAHRLGAP